ncbi:hypothetical protein BGZ76_009069 [Entomortierella beljakovae]|nr:hypothetical protein BGZ76_009069 [Entomortierella beljakovae]
MAVFADPQMEGDAKIARLGKRALVDLAFNDAFMRHVYNSVMKPSWEPLEMLSSLAFQNNNSWIHKPKSPTHVTILGDLFSSQWIDDAEFNVRLARYQSIFYDPAKVSSSSISSSDNHDIPILINITGNHDIGYGYDISQDRLTRWELVFGKSNFISTLTIPTHNSELLDQPRKLHFVVINTMLLDGPSSDENLRGQTWQFLHDVATIKAESPQDVIVILTHIPLHKAQGICVDSPDVHVHSDNTIIEQTMLTPNATTWILNNLKPEFILNGHDHFGCDVVHVQSQVEETGQHSWVAQSTSNFDTENSTSDGQIYVREVTQRSMMAEYRGYSGLFEVRIPNSASDKIHFNYTACAFYNDVQVWIVIITDIIVISICVIISLYKIFSSVINQKTKRMGQSQSPEKKLKML